MKLKKSQGFCLLTAIRYAAAVLFLLAAVFLAGSCGWKLFGFSFCQGAWIESVSVSENAVQISGHSPGLPPRGYLGYHAEETEGRLYVGFRFSGLFGFFETGRFEVTIPVKREITDVILKTGKNEYPLWSSARRGQ